MFEFDLSQLGVFALAALIPGIVQSAKEHFGVTGKWAFVLAMTLGVFFGGLGQAINEGLIPDVVLPWVSVLVVGLASGLGAAGYYDMLLKPIMKRLNGK